jgi:drug/metabolite transporter (DMT)-like permease
MKGLYTWGSILAVVLFSVTGDVLLSRAMKAVGNVGALFRTAGLKATAKAVAGSGTLWLGVAFMAIAFFSLLLALSWADLSLVAPASASLTFIGNAIAATLFLHERVDRRRWIAALLVSVGVALVAA